VRGAPKRERVPIEERLAQLQDLEMRGVLTRAEQAARIGIAISSIGSLRSAARAAGLKLTRLPSGRRVSVRHLPSQIAVRLPEPLMRRLALHSHRHAVAVNAIIVAAVEAFLGDGELRRDSPRYHAMDITRT
jgi:hypothetical protein